MTHARLQVMIAFLASFVRIDGKIRDGTDRETMRSQEVLSLFSLSHSREIPEKGKRIEILSDTQDL